MKVCPICSKSFPESLIEEHVNKCLDGSATSDAEVVNCPICKKPFLLENIEQHASKCTPVPKSLQKRTSQLIDDSLEMKLSALRERAIVDILKYMDYSFKIWLYVAQSIYEKGVLCYERRDMENSIVSFMKFTNIMNNLPKHLEYSYYIGSEQYINMIKKVPDAHNFVEIITSILMSNNLNAYSNQHVVSSSKPKEKKSKKTKSSKPKTKKFEKIEKIEKIQRFDQIEKIEKIIPFEGNEEEDEESVQVFQQSPQTTFDENYSNESLEETTNDISPQENYQTFPIEIESNVGEEGGDVHQETEILSTPQLLENPFSVRALYDYQAIRDDELSFKSNDVLEVLSVEDEWYFARLKSQTQSNPGFIPINYTEIIDPSDVGSEIASLNSEHSQLQETVIKEYKEECQKLISQYSSVSLESITEKELRRQTCILELIDSWKIFSDHLSYIYQNYIPKLKAYLSEREFIDTFSNFEEIVMATSELKVVLNRHQKESGYFIVSLGQLLFDNFQRLRVYAEFCGNARKSIEYLSDRAKYDVQFQELVQESGLTIQDVLSLPFKPMQRIVKLELFVKEIQKNTDKDVNHDDYWALNSAQGEIEDICLYINQIKCVIDDYGKQTESRINPCFDINFPSPSLRKLLYGGLVNYFEEGEKERISLMLVLFSDCLVLFTDDERKKKKDKKTFLGRKSTRTKHAIKRGTKTRYSSFLKPLFLPFVSVSDFGKTTIEIEDTLNLSTFYIETLTSTAKVDWFRLIKNSKESFEEGSVLRTLTFPYLTQEHNVNCCVYLDQKFIFGTDQGIAVVGQDGVWRFLKGMKKKVTQMVLFESQKLLFFITRDETGIRPKVFLATFPLSAFEEQSFNHTIKPSKIDGTNSIQIFSLYQDYEGHFILFFWDGEKLIESWIYPDGRVEEKMSMELKKQSHFFKIINGDLYFGSENKFSLLPANKNEKIKEFDHTHEQLLPSIPLDLYVFPESKLFCYQDYGILTDETGDLFDSFSICKWTSPAISFGYLDPYLLVFTSEYIEVRPISAPWRIVQYVSSKHRLLIDVKQRFFFNPENDKNVKNTVCTVTLV